VIVTYTTQNPTLVPTVILLGSFLVPMTFVLWAFDSGPDVLSMRDVVTGFVVGGVLGVMGASILESDRITGNRPLLQYVGVGLIEEFVKILAVVPLALRLPRYTLRDGAIFGTAGPHRRSTRDLGSCATLSRWCPDRRPWSCGGASRSGYPCASPCGTWRSAGTTAPSRWPRRASSHSSRC
jgi:hypothetical protein